MHAAPAAPASRCPPARDHAPAARPCSSGQNSSQHRDVEARAASTAARASPGADAERRCVHASRLHDAAVRRPSRPWAGPSSPRCRSRTPGSPASTPLRRVVRGSPPRCSSASASRHTTRDAVPASSAPRSALLRQQHGDGRASSSMKRQPLARVAPGRAARRRRRPSARPAAPTTISSRALQAAAPTRTSGPTPSARRWCASRLARAFSSA